MRWFEGQIASAISQAKQQKSLFVVYIRGTNDDSEKMDKTWEEREVAQTCEEAGLVVMKFQADSDECKQFSVYYPVICVPCVYVISGETGVLLESIGGFASSPDLLQKIKKVIESSKQGQVASPTPQQQQQPVATTSQAPVAAAQPEPVVQAQATPQAQASNAPKVTAPSTSSSSEAQRENAHERAARMRQKMEDVHRKKEQQKRDAEKQEEMERRKVGQKLQKADQQRANSQARQLADDIRKERLEDKVAREKVLQQLARDKAEKDARYRSEREQREQQKLLTQQEKEAVEKAEQAKREATQLDTATIQFRLPDGSTMTSQFTSGAPLQEALDFVTENVGAHLKEFTLSVTYPRRNFGPNEMQTSFLELGLAHRAAMVVLPGRLTPTSSRQSKSQVSSSSDDAGMFSWFQAQFLFIYNLIYNFFLGTPSETGAASSPPSSATPSQSPGDEDSTATERNSRNAGARPKSSYARRRTPASGGNTDNFSHREGNIHRMNTQPDDNDENNTWNGNSTQQM